MAVTSIVAAIATAALLLQQPETLSLLGEPLYPPSMDKKARAAAEAEYATARTAYEQHARDRAAILAFARANVALGRVGDALEVLTHGLEAIPDDPSLLLERGRGYIVIRKFVVAERDLRPASGTLPAAKCALAFAMYLSGDFPRARDAYASCPEPDLFSRLAPLRIGPHATHTPSVTSEKKGTVPFFPGSVAMKKKEPVEPLEERYSKAIARLMDGDEDAAREELGKIVDKYRRNTWMEPVYIAAEADYARLKKAEPKKKKKK